MKRVAMAVIVAAACAGCATEKKYKAVSVETDGSGKVNRRVESESVEQTSSTTKELKLKHIEY